MASKVHESEELEGQGYHRYGFGSFVANKQRQKPAQEKGHTVTHLRGIRERKPVAVSLPNILVSKLREKTPKRITRSLRCDNDVLAHMDCKYCKVSTKKRLIPSLIPHSMLPKFGEKVHQGSSGWGWSRKEYRIKQTKFRTSDRSNFDVEDPTELSIPNQFLTSYTHEPYQLTALEEEELKALTGDTASLPSFLLRARHIDFDIKNSKIGSSNSRTVAGINTSRVQTSNNAFSLFDFNPIVEHNPSSRKWSKLTALPHIQVSSDQKQPSQQPVNPDNPVDYPVDPVLEKCEILFPGEEESQSGNKATGCPVKTDGKKQQGASSRHKMVNMGNVTISFDKLPENSAPIQQTSFIKNHTSFSGRKPATRNSDPKLPVNYVSFGNAEVLPLTGTGGHFPPGNGGQGHYSTINIDNTRLNRHSWNGNGNFKGLEKRMSDLQNAVMIDNWIKILESTKGNRQGSDRGGDSPLSRGQLHTNSILAAIPAPNNVYPKYVPTIPLTNKQRKAASIDLVRFFNVPRSVVRDYDRLKQQCGNYQSFQKQVVPMQDNDADSASFPAEGNNHKQERKPHNLNALHDGERSLPSRGQFHKTMPYARLLPRWNTKDKGLMDLLAIQKMDTGQELMESQYRATKPDGFKPPSTLNTDVMHPLLHLQNIGEPHLESEGHESHVKQQLQIKVNITPRGIGGSVAIKPLQSLSPRPMVETSSFNRGHSEKVSTLANLSDQHVDNLLLHLPTVYPEQTGNKYGVKQGRARKVRQNPVQTYSERKALPVNAYPGLSIVGSSMLDTSDMAWKEEAKGLIIQLLKSKEGRNLSKQELRKLQSLFVHLQSEHPDLPTSNPEELLARLFMDGDGGKGLYFVDRRFSDTSETGSDSESDDMDWDLANNDEWLAKQDVDELLSKASYIEDPQILKRLILEKMKRDLGIEDADVTRELMEYINQNVHVMIDPETGRNIPIIPPALAKMIGQKGAETEHDSTRETNGSFNSGNIMAMLRAEEEASGGEGGYYYDFKSGAAHKIDFNDNSGKAQMILNALEFDGGGDIPEGLRSFIARNAAEYIENGGKVYHLSGRRAKDGKGRRRRRKEESGDEGIGSKERRKRRRERRRRRDEEGGESDEERRQRRRERRRRRGQEEESESDEERKQRRRERRRRRGEEGSESDEERRQRRRERRRRRGQEEGSESDEERKQRRRERRRRRGQEGSESDEERRQRRRERRRQRGQEGSGSDEERRQRRSERRRRRRGNEGSESDEERKQRRRERKRRRGQEEGSESDEERRQRRRERRRRRGQEEGSESDEERKQRRRERRRRRGEEDSESDEERRERRRRRRGQEEGSESDEERRQRRRERRRGKERSESESDEERRRNRREKRHRRRSKAREGVISDDDESSYDSEYDSSDYSSSDYTSDYTDYTSTEEERQNLRRNAARKRRGKDDRREPNTVKKLKEYKRVFNSIKTSMDPNSRKKRRQLGNVKEGSKVGGKGKGREDNGQAERRDVTTSPLFKGEMLREIGEVMDIVRTIKDSVSHSQSTQNNTTAHDGSTLSSSGARADQEGNLGELNTSSQYLEESMIDGSRLGGVEDGRERGTGGSLQLRQTQPRGGGKMETEASRALRQEEERLREEKEERQWKAKHRRDLESELAGDLDRQWKEIAEERKLRAETNDQVEFLTNERDRLMKQKKVEMREKHTKEKERYTNTLEKLRAEGLDRKHLHQNEREILAAYDDVIKVWSDNEYACISFYLGDDYANNLRQAEQARQDQERAYYEQQLEDAMDFQRNELLETLKHARQDFLLGLSMEASEMDQLLQISRAFVYSYFDSEVDKENYSESL